MLKCIFFFPLTVLVVKSSFSWIYYICYKTPTYFLININISSIKIFEKLLIEFSYKNNYLYVYYMRIFIYLLVQIGVIFLLY